MKKLLIALFAVILVTSPTWSQTEKKSDLFIGGGVAIPSSPEAFSTNWTTGFTLSGGVGVALSQASSFIFLIDYSNFSIDNEKMLTALFGPNHSSVSLSGGDMSALTVSGNIKWPLSAVPHSAAPYIIAGAGYYHPSISDMTISGYNLTGTANGSPDDAFFASLGLGLDIPASETASVFFEGKYTIALTSGENTCYIPIKAGVRIGL